MTMEAMENLGAGLALILNFDRRKTHE